jgi:hypothetical protein
MKTKVEVTPSREKLWQRRESPIWTESPLKSSKSTKKDNDESIHKWEVNQIYFGSVLFQKYFEMNNKT